MTKIIVVHWRGGLAKWYPYSLETLDELGQSTGGIEHIEIIEIGINATYTIKGEKQ